MNGMNMILFYMRDEIDQMRCEMVHLEWEL